MIKFKNRLFGLLTDEQVKTLPEQTVLLLPLGSLEPHGHLPLATDSMLATEILGRVTEVTEDTWLLPTVAIGYLFKYSKWPGSVGIPSETMCSTVFDIAAALARDGFRKIFVMSGHDENREPALQALREAHLKFGTLSVYCDWLDLGVSLVRQISSSRREGHASEIQTSVFQYLFPELELEMPKVEETGPARIGDDDLFVETETGTWVQSNSLEERHSFSGNPTHATVEKGRIVVEHIVERSRMIISEMRQKAR